MEDEVMEQETGLEAVPGLEETSPAPPEDAGQEDLDLEDMDLFGPADDPPQGEEPPEGQEPPEEGPEGQEPQEPEQPQVVEVGGQQVPVQELVQSAVMGQRAAQEVMQLREEVERYKSIFQEYAGMAGMDPDNYLATLEQQKEEIRIQQEAARMGVAPEVVRQMREAQRQREEYQAALEQQQRAQLEEQQRRARIEPYMELIRRYPELRDSAKLPQEVAAQIQAGTNPVIAYQDYMLGQREAAEQVQQQRQAVREKSPGSAAGVGNGEIDGDLAAFDAVINGDY